MQEVSNPVGGVEGGRTLLPSSFDLATSQGVTFPDRQETPCSITNLGVDRRLAPGGHWTLRMRYRLTRLIVTTTIACFAANSFGAAQSGSLRDVVRERGDIDFITIGCGPVTGLKEILQHTQLTVEGTIALAESRLTAQKTVSIPTTQSTPSVYSGTSPDRDPFNSRPSGALAIRRRWSCHAAVCLNRVASAAPSA